MRARAPRIVAVGTSPVQIRDTANGPVAFAIYRYPSGGGTIYIGTSNGVTTANGKAITADVDFTDFDQSLTRWMVSSSGTINVTIEDYES